MNKPRLVLATAPFPGAVAIVQLHGSGSRTLLQQLTQRDHFENQRVYFVSFNHIDEGLAVCRDEDWAQMMPHGGPRVVQKLIDQLIELGAIHEPTINNRTLYPEADSPIEADMLAAIAAAPSPAAIDLLAAQLDLWRRHTTRPAATSPLDRLLTPPTVVVAGIANVGKSTLTNAILGRAVSVVSDLPGATRDWVGSLAEIGTPAVAVHWLDTPGLRASDDAIEQSAIALAERVWHDADVLIAMRTPGGDYPAQLPREPDVWVVNQVDDAATSDAKELPISALHDRNLDALQQRVLSVLGLDTLERETLWAFSPTLRSACEDEAIDLETYVNGSG